MKEIVGNLWDYYDMDHVLCITTNGFVKANGECVMGRGCAKEATERVPGIAKRLGALINRRGNLVHWLNTGIVSFPVKHVWWEKGDKALIISSAEQLAREADNLRQKWFVLPRPGCGNGGLKWAEVKEWISFLPDNVHVISKGTEQ